LSYRRVVASGGRRRYCSDLGVTDPVFKTGAASLYLPAFRERISNLKSEIWKSEDWLPDLDSHQDKRFN